MTLFAINKPSLHLKDIVEINIDGARHFAGESNTDLKIDNSTSTAEAPSINNSNMLFLFLSKLYKKISLWLKYFINLSLFGFLILKLLGYNIISDVINNTLNLKKIIYTICLFSISYQFLSLYFLYKFSIKSLKISDI